MAGLPTEPSAMAGLMTELPEIDRRSPHRIETCGRNAVARSETGCNGSVVDQPQRDHMRLASVFFGLSTAAPPRIDRMFVFPPSLND